MASRMDPWINELKGPRTHVETPQAGEGGGEGGEADKVW